MYHKTEQEIMQKWESNPTEPMVSIACIAYNHEAYIVETIEGFLMQETDFSFEILIHDDASTDRTAEIIRKYEKKYPNLIKTIYQTENQYSKGIKVNPTFNYARAKGKYIALCEGDDYWTDVDKLQYQITKMKEYPECYMSFHPAILLEEETGKKTVQSKHFDDETVIPIEDIIVGNGGYCPTASIVISKDIIGNLPDFFKDAPVGDYFLQVYASNHGGALYLNKTMSVYRIHSEGWTSQVQEDVKKYKNFTTEMTKSLTIFDSFFNRQYNKEFLSMISDILLTIIYQPHISPEDKFNLYIGCVDLVPDKDVAVIDEKIIKELILINHNLKNESIKYLEEQVNNYQKALEGKESDITRIEHQLKEHLENYKKSLSEKEKGIIWLEEQLENHKKSLSEKEKGTTWLEERLENHKKSLSEKEEKIMEQVRSIVVRDDELNKYQNMLEIIDEKVFIMEQNINLLNQRLAYKETFKGLIRGLAKKIIFKIKRFF